MRCDPSKGRPEIRYSPDSSLFKKRKYVYNQDLRATLLVSGFVGIEFAKFCSAGCLTDIRGIYEQGQFLPVIGITDQPAGI